MDCILKQVVFKFARETYLPIKLKLDSFKKSTIWVPVHQASSSAIFNVHPSHLMMNFGPQFGLKISGEGGGASSSPGWWGGPRATRAPPLDPPL